MSKIIERKIMIIGSILILLTAVSAIGQTDDVEIDINITQSISIDVSPNSTSWVGLTVGETGTPNDFIVTNVGSVNISSLSANITNDASNPYGTGDVNNYNAGEFILLNTSSSAFFYPNKRNWNESVPGDVTNPVDWTEGADTGYFGIIRTASDSDIGESYYFFTNRTGVSGDCNTGSGVILIGNDPKTVTLEGSIDFTSGSEYTQVSLDSSGIGDIDAGTFNGYCVYVTADCSRATLFKWNADIDGSSGCDNDINFYTGTLTPGQTTIFWLEPKIPSGVPDVDVSQGLLTIKATAS